MKLFIILFFAQVVFTFHLYAHTFALKGKVTGAEILNYAYIFVHKRIGIWETCL